MEILLGGMAAFLVCAAFALGFLCGMKCTEKPAALPMAEAAEPDEEKKRQYEEDLKAFAQCMNYSLDMAYGGNDA